MRGARCIGCISLLLTLSAIGQGSDESPWGVCVISPSVAKLDTVRAAGIGWFRWNFYWYEIEPSDNDWRWGNYVPPALWASERDLSVLGVLCATPEWASTVPDGQGLNPHHWPPKNASVLWPDFVYNVVERFDGDGVDDCANGPVITHWEMWSEPNGMYGWLTDPDCYRDSILVLGAQAAKEANPNCVVLCAGPHQKPSNPDLLPWYPWLDAVFQDDGFDALDEVSFHYYYWSQDPRDIVPPRLDSLADLIADYGGGKGIWITETGSYTGGAPDSVCPDTQAVYLLLMCDIVHSRLEYPDETYMEKLFFYDLNDHNWDPPVADYGMVDTDLIPKPSYCAYQSYIRPLFSTSNRATAYNGGRKLVSWNEGDLCFAYQPADSADLIFAARSTDCGDSWAQEYVGLGRFPALAPGPPPASDYLSLVWIYCGSEIHCSRYTEAQGWSDPRVLREALASPGTIHMLPPSLAVSCGTTDVGHLAWEFLEEPEVYPGWVTYELHWSTFDPVATQTSQPGLIEDVILDQASEYVYSWEEVQPMGSVAIALRESQVPCVAWSRPIGQGKHDIYYKEMSPSGGWPTNPEIVWCSDALSLHPSISCNPVAMAVDVVWEEQEVDDLFEILHRRRMLGWGPVGSPSGLVSGDNSRYPVVDGDYCLWSQSSASVMTEIYYSQYLGSVVGEPPSLWSTPQNFSCTPPDSSEHPHLFHDLTADPEKVHGIWTDGNCAGYYTVKFKSVIGLGEGDLEHGREDESEREGGGQVTHRWMPVPRAFALSQNRPNPCRDLTVVSWHLRRSVRVSVQIRDVAGRLIRTLVNGQRAAGYHSVSWDGKCDSGERVAPGIYFYRVVAGDFTATSKMVVVR